MKICVYYSTLRWMFACEQRKSHFNTWWIGISNKSSLLYGVFMERSFSLWFFFGLSHCNFFLVFLYFFLCESLKTVVQLSSPKARYNGHYHPNWIIIRKNERISYGIGLSFFLSVLGRFILEFSLSAIPQPHTPLAMSDTSNVYV